MNRSAFTMVELIFVIVTIGILSSMALPRFSKVKDQAKINSELAMINSFDAVLTAAIEFQIDDFNNAEVDWHNLGDLDSGTGANAAGSGNIREALRKAYKAESILGGLGKKVEIIKAIGYLPYNKHGELDYSTSGSSLYYSPLILTGAASNSSHGVHRSPDVLNKPDKNDFWVFNPSLGDINITGRAGTTTGNNINTRAIEARTIALVDLNGTEDLDVSDIMISYNNGANTTNFLDVFNQ